MEQTKMIGKRIHKLSKQIKRRTDHLLSQKGITGVHGGVLHYVLAQAADKDIFQKDIEEEFNIRRSSATGILQLMEKNGIIVRESVSYDARMKKIILTDKAIEMKGQVISEIQETEKQLIQNISEEELKFFCEIIERMSKNIN